VRFKVVIPARYASTRLPGKALLDLAGRPLIQHVYERAVESGAQAIVIATDDARIRNAALSFGATVVMTSRKHASGTDRMSEVLSVLAEPEDSIVVNLQGDEPLMPGAAIRQVAALLNADPDASMATLCERISEARDVFDPNVVKVVVDDAGRALYFSRAPVPWDRQHFATHGSQRWPLAQPYYRHIGLYGYRAGFVKRFSQLSPCAIERAEALEQLRALHYGARILVAESCAPTGSNAK